MFSSFIKRCMYTIYSCSDHKSDSVRRVSSLATVRMSAVSFLLLDVSFLLARRAGSVDRSSNLLVRTRRRIVRCAFHRRVPRGRRGGDAGVHATGECRIASRAECASLPLSQAASSPSGSESSHASSRGWSPRPPNTSAGRRAACDEGPKSSSSHRTSGENTIDIESARGRVGARRDVSFAPREALFARLFLFSFVCFLSSFSSKREPCVSTAGKPCWTSASRSKRVQSRAKALRA